MADVTVLQVGARIEGLERDLGVSADAIAMALGVDVRTVECWRMNERAPQGKPRERLSELTALRDQLLRVFGTAGAAQAWLLASSRYLGGLTPLEALTAGHFERVRADLEGLAAGVYL